MTYTCDPDNLALAAIALVIVLLLLVMPDNLRGGRDKNKPEK